MTDGFAQMIATARSFLGQLETNNDRDWFDARKSAFKSDIEAPLRLLADLVAEDLSRRTGVAHAGKVGRIYRDVRFSRDKRPFYTHLHASWTLSGGTGPGWLLHIDRAGTTLMTGLHALDADGVGRYRAAVDRDGAALQALLDAGRAAGADLVDFADTTLKRVPRPYDQDHPHGALLRRKQIALGAPIDAGALREGLMPALSDRIGVLLPFWRWCHAVPG